MDDEILKSLNSEQYEAVTHQTGPQLVVAGAGTGKTAVITRRIAYLVSSKQCAAKNILALTFTDKAAEEMESRVDVLVPYGFTDSTICTFHAFGDKLLKEYGFLLGLTPDYKVLSTSEQLIFLREHLFELPLQRLRPVSNPTKHLQLLLSIISRAKDEDVSPEQYLDYCRELEHRLVNDEVNTAEQMAMEKQLEISQLYQRYQQLMLENGFVDFGDLINLSLKLLREHPDVLDDLRKQYQYILVDEFQDTNAAQFELIKLLAGDQANITVVGDDDQSIYKFRGAAISNILQFNQMYPQARIRVLTRNYRSTQPILDTAYRLIRHNDPERLEVKHQLDKHLKAAVEGGQPVKQVSFDTVSSEADWVADHMSKDKEKNKRTWSDYAVLVRTKKQADPFIRALNLKNIPLRFSGNQGLYKRPEVKLCIAALRLIADPGDPLAFHEIASSDIIDLPPEDLAMLASLSRKTNIAMMELLKRSLAKQEKPLSQAGQVNGEKLVELINQYLEMARRMPAGQLLYRFITETGMLAKYTEKGDLESDLMIKNIAKFFNVVKRYEQLAKSDKVIHFVEHLDMLEDVGDDPTTSAIDEDIEAVHILTVHRSKGLEFPVVYMVGLAANRFPPVNRHPALAFPLDLAKEALPDQDQSLPEERRLFYVAMTRAKEELLLSCAKDYGGKRTYKPSRFVMEALGTTVAKDQVLMVSAMEQIKTHAPTPKVVNDKIIPLKKDDVLSLSYYQIDDYQTCPLKYKYVHLLKIPVLPHHSVFYGNAMHAAIDAFYRKRMRHQEITFEEIEQAFKKAWVNQGFISREHEESRWHAGLLALKQFMQRELANARIPEYVEKSFSFNMGYNKIVGRIDRIDQYNDGSIVITDFKSTEVMDQNEADKKAKASLQLQLYALAWLETEKQRPQSLCLYFLENGLIGKTEPSEDKLTKTRAIISEVAEGIRQRNFTAKPGTWTCQYCAYRTICPDAEKA